MEAVRGHLLLTNCLEDELTRPNIELAMKADRLLWLDLEGTDDEVLTLLHEVFKIHPLAVEDVREFTSGRRSRTTTTSSRSSSTALVPWASR
jgi:Mg2+ and Co2+ transporter CorA